MTEHRNQLGQRIGFPLPGWVAPPHPPRQTLVGRFCRLEPLYPDRHAAALHEANLLDPQGRMWTYLPYGPFETLEDYLAWMRPKCAGSDPQFYAVVNLETNSPVGLCAYLRITPEAGSIEIGHLSFSPLLQRTPGATEAMFLMMRRAFELGYRRYEWKCDLFNEPSRMAAERLGFTFEGIFRQATVYKSRSRDTIWLSIIDSEWPAVQEAMTRWLAPENFDERRRQKKSLRDFRSGK